MSDTIIEVKDKRLYALAAAALVFIVAGSFSLGMAYQTTIQPDKPYEVNVSGGGVVMLIPPGWGAYQIQDEYRKNYIKPTDREG